MLTPLQATTRRRGGWRRRRRGWPPCLPSCPGSRRWTLCLMHSRQGWGCCCCCACCAARMLQCVGAVLCPGGALAAVSMPACLPACPPGPAGHPTQGRCPGWPAPAAPPAPPAHNQRQSKQPCCSQVQKLQRGRGCGSTPGTWHAWHGRHWLPRGLHISHTQATHTHLLPQGGDAPRESQVQGAVEAAHIHAQLKSVRGRHCSTAEAMAAGNGDLNASGGLMGGRLSEQAWWY
jgi:hypothetical protein